MEIASMQIIAGLIQSLHETLYEFIGNHSSLGLSVCIDPANRYSDIASTQRRDRFDHAIACVNLYFNSGCSANN